MEPIFQGPTYRRNYELSKANIQKEVSYLEKNIKIDKEMLLSAKMAQT